jgi:hypothetical protein
MAIVNAAQSSVKTVADPNASYDSLKPLWDKSRAVCSGERYVKEFDGLVDTIRFTNLLIPFSPSMSQSQYEFYKAEAELPGITAQFAKMLVGGLLRKQPILTLPNSVPEEAKNWIINEFGKDDTPLTSFLDAALYDEIQTSRAWVFVDYPQIMNPQALSSEDFKKFKPYPILQKAESIVNWRTKTNKHGKTLLDRVIVRGYRENYEVNEFHPTFRDTVWVHELDDQDLYCIRIYERSSDTTQVTVIDGKQYKNYDKERAPFELVDTIDNILSNGERLGYIPAWPLNGTVEAVEPMLMPVIDKEISLYNKISRRNHLLYGASTYTPIIISDMPDDDFDEIVQGGLGTWLRLRQGDDAKVLETPTAALQDMDRAIASSIEEMSKLGIKMLSPETAQSGVALEIRNAAQTAQLGTLSNKISNVMKQIITCMVNWRYDLQLECTDVEFTLTSDFNPVPLGSDWLRLATEWYQGGLIPRSVWLQLLKQNDMVEPEYDDEAAKQEITADQLLMPQQPNDAYAQTITQQ